LLTNPGVSVPELSASPLRFVLFEAARVTTTTYGLRVTPSCAVTVVVIRFEPTAREHRFCAHTPEAFATTTAAFASLRVGVTTTDDTPFATLAA
jgi:hypothetical protein